MRGSRRVRQSAMLVLLLAPAAIAQRADRTAIPPRLLIETFRANDTLSHRAASLLRPTLAQYLASGRAQVITNQQVRGAIAQGIDRYDRPGNWADVREITKLFGADIVIDLIARSEGNRVRLASYRYRPATRAIDTLPEIRARSVGAAVDQLARLIAADTIALPRRK